MVTKYKREAHIFKSGLTYLEYKRSFRSGFTSVWDIFNNIRGSYFAPVVMPSDTEALREAWLIVGNDISSSMKEVQQEIEPAHHG